MTTQFEQAIERYLAASEAGELGVVNAGGAGNGQDWGDDWQDRAAVWAGVSATEADYDARFTKVDGREG